jgi:hypothetical protein
MERETVRKAILTVLHNSRDMADAWELLQALGLEDPERACTKIHTRGVSLDPPPPTVRPRPAKRNGVSVAEVLADSDAET